jgi:hypothetical protein
LKRFLRDQEGEWNNPNPETRKVCFEEAGLLRSLGGARSLSEAIVEGDIHLALVENWLEGKPSLEIDELFSSHRQRDYGYKDWIPTGLRRRVLQTKKPVCVICGSTENIHLDHIIPEACGGPTTFGNLQPMCGRDNSIKGRKNINNAEVLSLRIKFEQDQRQAKKNR